MYVLVNWLTTLTTYYKLRSPRLCFSHLNLNQKEEIQVIKEKFTDGYYDLFDNDFVV